MKLNAGSGGVIKGIYKYSEWINLDFNHIVKTEVQGDMLHLPFKDKSFDEIHLVHVFEHIQRPDQLPCLREMHRVLEKGGSLFIEVPDFQKTVEILMAVWTRPDDWNYQRIAHNMTASLYGKQRYPGDAHHWGFTPRTLHEALDGAVKWSSFSRLVDPDAMISPHYKMEPVILVKVTR